MDLAAILEKGEEIPQLVIVTGESGAGKTKWCQEQIQWARQQGWNVAGLLSPAIFQDGQKVGIDLLDLSSGEKRQLAKLRPHYLPQATIKKWAMDPLTLAWANDCLQAIGPCDLLVVDELGPLEFNRGQGFTPAFPLIERGDYQIALIIVRPTLLEQAQSRWPQLTQHIIHIQPEPPIEIGV